MIGVNKSLHMPRKIRMKNNLWKRIANTWITFNEHPNQRYVFLAVITLIHSGAKCSSRMFFKFARKTYYCEPAMKSRVILSFQREWKLFVLVSCAPFIAASQTVWLWIQWNHFGFASKFSIYFGAWNVLRMCIALAQDQFDSNFIFSLGYTCRINRFWRSSAIHALLQNNVNHFFLYWHALDLIDRFWIDYISSIIYFLSCFSIGLAVFATLAHMNSKMNRINAQLNKLICRKFIAN